MLAQLLLLVELAIQIERNHLHVRGLHYMNSATGRSATDSSRPGQRGGSDSEVVSRASPLPLRGKVVWGAAIQAFVAPEFN